MNAVIYARYSSAQQRAASVADQLRKCEARARQEGWQVVSRYSDEAVSGSRSDRPGYQALLAAAQRREFDVLLVEDLSRLSRDQVESEGTIRRLEFWKIRVVGISDGYDSTSKARKVHRGVKGLMNELYLDDLKEKTHRGLEGQALKGLHTGGRAYGYRLVKVLDPARVDAYGEPVVIGSRREVDPAQAAVVVEIFERYARGDSPRRIADELNRRGVPSPGAGWKREQRRRGGWLASAIAGPSDGTGILNNPSYIGRVVWNRTTWQKDPDSGKRRPVVRPEAEWVVQEAPELRIVSDDLWERVKARQREQTSAVGERIRQGLTREQAGRSGRGPKFLFSGLLRCGCCGSRFVIVNATHYGCASHTNGGASACANRLRVRRDVVESRLLAGIKEGLLAPERVAAFQRGLQRRIAAEAKAPAPGADRIAQLRQEIANMTDAIASGLLRASPALAARLAAAEDELARLEAQQRAAPKADKLVRLLPRLADEYRAMVEGLGDVVLEDVPRARQLLRRVVGDEIKLMQSEDGSYLEAEVAAGLGGLLEASTNSLISDGKNNLVAGARFGTYLLRIPLR